MAESGDLKRRREDEIPGELDSFSFEGDFLKEAKRLRADHLLNNILDDDSDNAGEQELADVMKSLEEEIALPSPSSPPPETATETPDEEGVVAMVEQPDIGYLFEASDDELGLPPSAPSSYGTGQGEISSPAEPLGEVGFGQIWAFDDEMNGFDRFEFEMYSAAAAADDGVVLDGGLFEYADVLCGPLDLTEFSWRSESLPAV